MDALLASYEGSSSDEEETKDERKGTSTSLSSLTLPPPKISSVSLGVSNYTPPSLTGQKDDWKSVGGLKKENTTTSTFAGKTDTTIEPVISIREKVVRKNTPGLPQPTFSLPPPKIMGGGSLLFSALPAPKGASKSGKKLVSLGTFPSGRTSAEKGVSEADGKDFDLKKRKLEDDEEETDPKKSGPKKTKDGFVPQEGVKSGLASFLPPPKHTLGAGSAHGGGRRSMMETKPLKEEGFPSSNVSIRSKKEEATLVSKPPVWTESNTVTSQVEQQQYNGSHWSHENMPVNHNFHGYSETGRVDNDSHQMNSNSGYHGPGPSENTAQVWNSEPNVYYGAAGENSSYGGNYGVPGASSASQDWSQAPYSEQSFSPSVPQAHSYPVQSYGSETVGSVGGVAEPSNDPLAQALAAERRKGRGMPTEGLKIKEVNQQDLTKGHIRADQMRATGIAFGPSYLPVSTSKDKPDKVHRRKHQIGSLYYDMRQKEMELLERKAKGHLTKSETQAKYGW